MIVLIFQYNPHIYLLSLFQNYRHAIMSDELGKVPHGYSRMPDAFRKLYVCFCHISIDIRVLPGLCYSEGDTFSILITLLCGR